jgi:formamidopyrimidine-DNA glycosylase
VPELPEVETVRKGLAQFLIGRRISSVFFDWPKSFPNSLPDVQSFILGSQIMDIKRRGKVLMIGLSSNYSLVVHLKMTGQLVYRSVKNQFGAGHPNDSLIGELPDKSTRVIFCLDAVGQQKGPTKNNKQLDKERWTGADSDYRLSFDKLFFNDQRKFGWIRLIPTSEVMNIDFLKKIGPEPLQAGFTSGQFIERLNKRPNSKIKAVLLDQSIVAGIGNIYADESLYAAKIHPESVINYISKSKLINLHNELINILKKSIELGGSSDRNYVDVKGGRGGYLNIALVFRKNNQACLRCGTIINKIRVAGRGTHICKTCQIVSRKKAIK